MNNKYLTLNRIMAAAAFVLSFIVYLITMAPTTSFWDCGEFISTSFIMGVPHPPGSPLFLLLGNFFLQIPTFSDVGARVNLISPIFSALSVTLVYLIIVQLIEEWRGKISSNSDAMIAYGSAFLGALTFAMTDSHWFNAVETEVYAMSTFFTAIVVWLILKWSQNEGHSGNVRYILIIAYIFGLAIGIHLLNLLALPFIGMIIYYKKFDFKLPSFLGLIAVTGVVFVIIYQGIIKGLPNLAAKFGIAVPIFVVLAVIAAMVMAILKEKHLLATILTSFVLILIGYSTYTVIFVRATQHPIINENNPDTFDGAVMYLNREQYGDWNILDRKATLKRPECTYWNRYTTSKQYPTDSDALGYLWNYQVKEMYLRYFAWQFIGRGDFTWPVETKDGRLIKYLEGVNIFRYGLPLAFLLGIAGMLHHFFKDWRRALAVLALFIITGLLIVIYLNQYDPQPRERDYSYVGSFMAFSIWIGIGIAGLMERVKQFLKKSQNAKIISFALLVFLFIVMPVRMLATDYHEHDRSGNFVAWDYAYNMLNSCEPNGILFTNGDNDTFPLWYLQEVEGVRKDIRVVNLSLLNTPWYVYQLRDYNPKIPLSLSDQDINTLTPIPWETREVTMSGRTETDPKVGWQLKPTYAGQYLRVQDLMIYRILSDVKWKIPVYFAVTVSPDNQIGLNKYMQMEGLVYKVYPEHVPEINYDRMLQFITQTKDLTKVVKTADDWESHMASGDGMFRYRNLDNPDVFFNSNIQRLTQNYRSGFLRLALENVYSNEPGKGERTYRILKEMDRYFPPELLPFNNPDLELQIARLYSEAGYKDEILPRLDELIEENLSLETKYFLGQLLLQDLNEPERAVLVFQSLYEDSDGSQFFEIMLGLVQAHTSADNPEAAIQVLENWILKHPEDEDAREMMKMLKGENS
ncbi:MAG: DUF2723 domain-containing protein [FCB group bacterium]|nr:DUF2723 domain-containing protein [FCB group bacterium]